MENTIKKFITGLSASLLVAAFLSGCGSDALEEFVEQTNSGAAVDSTESTEINTDSPNETNDLHNIGEYTIIFDRNTTSDDISDNEIYEYKTVTYDETGASVEMVHTSVVTVPYSADACIDSAPPAPSREGYYFAGWQTRPDVTIEDLVYGVSPYQWFFGNQIMLGGGQAMYIQDIENISEDGTATLYARWVEMKDIATEEELRAIGNDLYGAYQLTADILLTEPWNQIGYYFTNYEAYAPEWWTYAFRGILEGNGHTISGLVINGADSSEERFQNDNVVWHDEGDTADGTAAMFGALACATIQNLTIKDAKVTVAGEYAAKGDYVYVAPLAAFDMESNLENIVIENPVVEVKISDEQSVIRPTIFTSVSCMIAGGWTDTITNCRVINGQVRLDGQLLESHGGEIYVGGMLGECYAYLSNNTVDVSITVNVLDQSAAEEDAPLKVNVGGMNASNTMGISNVVDSSISVNVKKPEGDAVINVGGFTGAQRYMSAEGNTISAELNTVCELDPEIGYLNIGRICGTIDFYYLTQVLLYTPVGSAGFSRNTAQMTWNKEVVEENAGVVPSLEGQSVGWINKGEYEISEGYVVPSNIEALAEAYGSYMPIEYLNDGIIWIIND